MNEDNPTGELRPMIDREPPNVDKTQGAVLGKTVLRDLRGWFEPSDPCLAGEAAYRRPSGAGIRGISASTRSSRCRRSPPRAQSRSALCPAFCNMLVRLVHHMPGALPDSGTRPRASLASSTN
jgi:hypothetical protein